jgi:hypothetical protein
VFVAANSGGAVIGDCAGAAAVGAIDVTGGGGSKLSNCWPSADGLTSGARHGLGTGGSALVKLGAV